jgi:hypothetical protein
MTADDSLELFHRIERASADSHHTRAASRLTIKEAQQARASFAAQQKALAAELHRRKLKSSAPLPSSEILIAHRPSPIAHRTQSSILNPQSSILILRSAWKELEPLMVLIDSLQFPFSIVPNDRKGNYSGTLTASL